MKIAENSIRLDIQGLRAIAVLAVMIFHLDKNLLPAGFLGVDIFFVISGYIVTRLILNKINNNTFSIKDFYIGRVKRIVPAYLFLLSVVSLFSITFLIEKDFSFYYKSLISSIFFYANFYFAKFGDYFAPSSNELPLLHLWSLAIEMQFYLILPFILILFKKYVNLKNIIILILLILIINQFLISYFELSIYFNLFSRIPEFLFGVLAAFILNKNDIKVKYSNLISCIGIILVIVSFFIVSDSNVPGIIVLIPSIGILMIIFSKDGVINKFLSNSILVWIGGISYSLYLWHWTILAFARYYYQEYELSLIFSIFYFIFSFLFAYISYKIIETPFRKKTNMKKMLIFIISVLVILFVFIIFFGKYINKNVYTTPIELTRYANSNICHGKMIGNCLKGDLSSSKPILVVGDSHAAQLNIFFDNYGNRSSRLFKILTASECPPISGFEYETLRKHSQKACKEQIDIVKSEIEKSDIIIITALWGGHIKRKNFLEALSSFFENNKEKKIIVLADTPQVSINPLREMRFYNFGIQKDNKSYIIDQDFVNKQIKNIVDSKNNKNILFLDLTTDNKIFDTLPYYNNKIIYFDKNHLNEIGSIEYEKHSFDKLDTVLKNYKNGE